VRAGRSYSDFRKEWSARKLASGYVLLGSEDFLVSEALTVLRTALLTDDFTKLDALPGEGNALLVDPVLQPVLAAAVPGTEFVPAETGEQQDRLRSARQSVESFDYSAFIGRETDVDQVLAQVRTMPFLGRRRLVIVRDFDLCRKDGRERLLDELKKDSSICRLVLTAAGDDWKLERLIQSRGVSKYLVTLPVTGAAEADEFIESWVRRNRIGVAPEARLLLLEVTGGSLGQLNSELEKMKTALGPERDNGKPLRRDARASARPPEPAPAGTITKEQVRDLAGHWREYQVSEFVDAVVRRDRPLALARLRSLSDWSEEPVKISAWLAGRFGRMLARPYGDSRLWSDAELTMALRHLAAIDLKLKRGYPERYYLLEMFVIRRTPAARRTG
jgi:DNA polymerase III delta subunit